MSHSKKKKLREKEQLDELVAITDLELKNSLKDSTAILETHNKPIKYSEIFHDFMSIAIEELIDDEKSLKQVLDWGQMIWNKGVAANFPNDQYCKAIESIFPIFEATFHDKPLVAKFLNRKKEFFSNENFLIVKQTSHLGTNGSLAISVAAYEIKDNPTA